jgi:hypothetical protein
MKKTFLLVICIVVLILGLFLVSCQKQEEVTQEKETVTEPAGEEKPAEDSGSGEKEETGGY